MLRPGTGGGVPKAGERSVDSRQLCCWGGGWRGPVADTDMDTRWLWSDGTGVGTLSYGISVRDAEMDEAVRERDCERRRVVARENLLEMDSDVEAAVGVKLLRLRPRECSAPEAVRLDVALGGRGMTVCGTMVSGWRSGMRSMIGPAVSSSRNTSITDRLPRGW